ncbi:MAG: hypothetical protein QHH14_02895 [Clostridiales bacterium]|jgi:hypothetical protein|nr:hypothetical protein [Clostridiales bacterium]
MRKGAARLIQACLVLGLVILGCFSSCERTPPSEAYQWMTIDENYNPQNFVEQFIKADSEEKNIFPVYIKNYDQDRDVLRQFRGSSLARPNEAALKMAFPGLEEWMLVDLKYGNERGQEVLRTILYVRVEGKWKVGDSGRLLK